MAISKSETQIQWSAANSLSVSSSSTGTSDSASIGATVIDGSVQLKADNDGTPASGDTVDFYALFTNGDPDGASTDEFDTAEQGTLLAVLDTNSDDPAIATVPLPTVSAKSVKIYAVNNSSGRAITVSAALYLTTSS